MAKKTTAKTDTKKSTKPAKLDRKGDNDLDIARARSLDGDTANDPADEGVQDRADEAGVEADGENDKASDQGGSDAAARGAVSGYDGAEAAFNATTILDGAAHETLTQLVPQEDETLPASRKHYGIVTLRGVEGDEYEFGVSHPDTARQIANAFNGVADEMSRRRA